MCNDVSCYDFTIIEKDGTIIYENEKYKHKDGSTNRNEEIPQSLDFNVQFDSDVDDQLDSYYSESSESDSDDSDNDSSNESEDSVY